MSSWDNGQVERMQQRVREQEDQIHRLQEQIDNTALVIPDKAVEWAGDDQDEPHNQQVFTRMINDIVNRQIQSVHDDYQALIDEDALKARVGRVRKALLDEGVHPPYHRRQVERLRQEWPTLYNAIMHLVKP